MNEMAILINTCDAYSDVWKPFFLILKNVWPEAKDYKIYLNTESKQYTDGFFNIEVLNCENTNSPWGERLLNAVEKIREEYILFLLEDFFFENKIDNEFIKSTVEIMKNNISCAAITYISTYDLKENRYTDFNESFGKRKRCSYFKLNASPTLYRKYLLKKYTMKKDTPWSWEFFGSIRTWTSNYAFLAKKSSADDIFLYDVDHGGAVHRGKWVGVSVRRIFHKYDIDIDLNCRGVVEDWMVDDPFKPKRNLFTILRNKWLFLYNYMLGLIINIMDRRL